MVKKREWVDEYAELPESGAKARSLGLTHYFTGKRCTKGHLSPRYASSGNCVECIEDLRGGVKINIRGRSSKRSAENQRLAENAHESGHKSYRSTSPCPNGHYEKFVTTNNCVQCGKDSLRKRRESAKWGRIKKLYGMSPNDFMLMLRKQNGQCAICMIELKEKNTHIDHNHTTGDVRALLCNKCNQAIGLFDEDAARIKVAIRYLEKFGHAKRLPKKND